MAGQLTDFDKILILYFPDPMKASKLTRESNSDKSKTPYHYKINSQPSEAPSESQYLSKHSKTSYE